MNTAATRRVVALVLIAAGILLLVIWYALRAAPSQPAPAAVPPDAYQAESDFAAASASAKGVIQLASPSAGSTITSPLQITGLVYGNNGTLTIELAQAESGVVVAEKTTVISGQSDQIQFAESLLFALPVVPQTGILTVTYADAAGVLDDSVSIEVSFPSDLGSGLE
ncbi:MAG: hypothetical protein HY372_03480 [Candidatus Andersenbacteria bacterium]|nr:hypothetical protein [Candidatus Andersenbacteria bacterium]